MRLRYLVCPFVLSLGLAVAGCGGGGADTKNQNEVRTTTTGQELTDLQKAYASGAITQEEYEKQREKILERDN